MSRAPRLRPSVSAARAHGAATKPDEKRATDAQSGRPEGGPAEGSRVLMLKVREDARCLEVGLRPPGPRAQPTSSDIAGGMAAG